MPIRLQLKALRTITTEIRISCPGRDHQEVMPDVLADPEFTFVEAQKRAGFRTVLARCGGFAMDIAQDFSGASAIFGGSTGEV